MKKILSISFVVLIFEFSIFGQTTKADLKQLQKEIGLPSSVSITKDDVSFPASKPTKIYLAIKYSKKSAQDFADWVAQWNKTNAAQFGEMQIVDNLNDADIAAVQYQFGAARTVREESARLKIGKVDRDNNRIDSDKTVLSRIGNSNARVEDSAESLRVPLYSYLILRGQNSSWNVDYSRVDERLSNKIFPDLLLQTAIEERLKNR